MRCLSVYAAACLAASYLQVVPGIAEAELVVWEQDHMTAVRRHVEKPKPEFDRALKNLRNAATLAIQRGPYSVIHKGELPPSGDKHDYLSYSRYWWPNPETEDGLPYVRRDGETNVRLRARGDRDRIGQLFIDVEALTLAYYFFGDEEFAQHASDLIRTWFLDPDTKMNPNLNFGQAVPGRSQGRGVGIIDTRGFIVLLDCVALLHDSNSFSSEDHRRLQDWFSEFLVWLKTSELGKEEQSAENNHGSWYAGQISRIALFVGDDDFARQIVRQTRDSRIPNQFQADGSQPHENKRTKSLHYCFFNLSALSVVARVGEHLGIDLWNSSADSGGGLEQGFAHVQPYLTNQEAWPHKQLDSYELSPKIIQLLRQASVRYKNPVYAEVIGKVEHRHRGNNYASLVCAAYTESAEEKEPRVEVLEGGRIKLQAYDLPDISQYTVQNVANLIPTAHVGRVSIERTNSHSLLDESFRRDRGTDLQRRQGTKDTLTIVIDQGAISVRQLVDQLKNPQIASRTDAIVTVRLPILIQPGGTLVVDGSEVEELRLSTDRGAFIANAGTLIVHKSRVTSWGEENREPTVYAASEAFRPFISSYIRSKTYLAGSTFQHLGYHAPTAYGLSLSSHPERERGEVLEDWPTGQLIENEFIGLYYGFYSYEARDVAIVGNVYEDSICYGIDPHDRSTRLIIAKNVTKGTRERHGIIGSRGVSHSFIFQNKTHDNHGSGIMLDRQCKNVVVADNQVFDNGQGVAVYESPNNLVADNCVVGNEKSGVRVRNSAGVVVQANLVVGNGDYAFEVYSKRLADHEKRASRGDLYTGYVDAALLNNVATGNLGGCVKGSQVQSLSLFAFRTEFRPGDREQIVAHISDPLNTDDDDEFGSELKPFADELRQSLNSDGAVVRYSN